MMAGGYLSFQGFQARANFARSPIGRRAARDDARLRRPRRDARRAPRRRGRPGATRSPRPGAARPPEPCSATTSSPPRPDADVVATVGDDVLIATMEVEQGRSLVWTSDIGPHWCPEEFLAWDGFAPARRRHAALAGRRRSGLMAARRRSCSTATPATTTRSRSCSRWARRRSTCSASRPRSATARSRTPPATPSGCSRWPGARTSRSPSVPRGRSSARRTARQLRPRRQRSGRSRPARAATADRSTRPAVELLAATPRRRRPNPSPSSPPARSPTSPCCCGTTPRCMSTIAEIIFMGGSTERGNHTPTAEFNTYADPEALDIVLRSGCRSGWSASTSPTRRWRPRRSWSGWPPWTTRWAAPARRGWASSATPTTASGSSTRRPSTTPARSPRSSTRPSSSGARRFVAVELDGHLDPRHHGRRPLRSLPDQAANASVAMKLDAERYWDLVLASLDRLGAAVVTRSLICVVGSINEDTTLRVPVLPGGRRDGAGHWRGRARAVARAPTRPRPPPPWALGSPSSAPWARTTPAGWHWPRWSLGASMSAM